MIKLSRILVHCDSEQFTLRNTEDLQSLRERLAREINVSESQITFTYSEIPTDNETN